MTILRSLFIVVSLSLTVYTTTVCAQTADTTRCGRGKSWATDEIYIEHGQYAITFTAMNPAQGWKEITLQCPELEKALKAQSKNIFNVYAFFIDRLWVSRINGSLEAEVAFNATIGEDTTDVDSALLYKRIRCIMSITINRRRHGQILIFNCSHNRLSFQSSLLVLFEASPFNKNNLLTSVIQIEKWPNEFRVFPK